MLTLFTCSVAVVVAAPRVAVMVTFVSAAGFVVVTLKPALDEKALIVTFDGTVATEGALLASVMVELVDCVGEMLTLLAPVVDPVRVAGRLKVSATFVYGASVAAACEMLLSRANSETLAPSVPDTEVEKLPLAATEVKKLLVPM